MNETAPIYDTPETPPGRDKLVLVPPKAPEGAFLNPRGTSAGDMPTETDGQVAAPATGAQEAMLELVIPLGPEALVMNALYKVGDFDNDKTPEALETAEAEVADATKTYYFNFIGRSFKNRPGAPHVHELLSRTGSLSTDPLLEELTKLRDDAREKDMDEPDILQITHAMHIGRILLQERSRKAASKEWLLRELEQ